MKIRIPRILTADWDQRTTREEQARRHAEDKVRRHAARRWYLLYWLIPILIIKGILYIAVHGWPF